MAINIIKNTASITHNTSSGRQTPKCIVMHYTASNGGTAANHIAYFSNPSTTQASADFFVDDTSIRQYNNRIESRYSWAVGDGSGGTYGSKCYNSNQISVEMCCHQSGGKWYISDSTYKNAVELVKYLMAKYKIPATNVIRHYDVSCKLCPNAVGWLKSTGSETTWQKFKSEIAGSTTSNAIETAPAVSTPVKTFKVRVSISDLRIRKSPSLSGAFVKFCPPGVYTIVDTKTADGYEWGKLKSGAGWIALKYVTRV